MLVDTDVEFQPFVFTPFLIESRSYYFMFSQQTRGPIWISPSDLLLEGSMFYFGDIYQGVEEHGQAVGIAFYSSGPVTCEATYLLAYSGVFKEQFSKAKLIKDIGMELVIKAPTFFVFHRTNVATLIVNPSIRRGIRENLEV